MTKDEALDLALEALAKARSRIVEAGGSGWKLEAQRCANAITAIKQARALDKKAENARELGLDYEPVLKDNSNYRYDPPVAEPVWIQPDHLQKAQKAPFLCRVEPHKREDFIPLYTTPPAQPSPVQEPWKYRCWNDEAEKWELTDDCGWPSEPVYTTPPAAQRQWVGLNQDELDAMFRNTIKGKKLVNYVARAIEAKLKEKNT